MEALITLALNFIYSSATLALIVLGLAMVFGLLGVMNMAHGEFVMLGAYSAYVVQSLGLNFIWAVPISILVCVIVGWFMEWSIIRHLYKRPFDTLLATWGVAILIRMPGTVDLFGITYPSYRLVLVAIILCLFTVLFLWYQKSKTGLRIKAMVQNPELASAVGIDTARLSTATFIIGVSFAGLAGVLLAPLVRVEPYIGLDYLLSSFFILIVGGLGTLEGLLIGSAVIGGSDALISTIFDKTAGYLSVLLISILFLWLRPNGIFSRH